MITRREFLNWLKSLFAWLIIPWRPDKKAPTKPIKDEPTKQEKGGVSIPLKIR